MAFFLVKKSLRPPNFFRKKVFAPLSMVPARVPDKFWPVPYCVFTLGHKTSVLSKNISYHPRHNARPKQLYCFRLLFVNCYISMFLASPALAVSFERNFSIPFSYFHAGYSAIRGQKQSYCFRLLSINCYWSPTWHCRWI